jgi:hypothetical protein
MPMSVLPDRYNVPGSLGEPERLGLALLDKLGAAFVGTIRSYCFRHPSTRKLPADRRQR